MAYFEGFSQFFYLFSFSIQLYVSLLVLQGCSLKHETLKYPGVLVLALVFVEEEVEEEKSSKEGRLHLGQAARGEVDEESVALRHVGHVGGRL